MIHKRKYIIMIALSGWLTALLEYLTKGSNSKLYTSKSILNLAQLKYTHSDPLSQAPIDHLGFHNYI